MPAPSSPRARTKQEALPRRLWPAPKPGDRGRSSLHRPLIPTAEPYAARVASLRRLWREHDRLERQIVLLERTFTDDQLTRLGAGAAPPTT